MFVLNRLERVFESGLGWHIDRCQFASWPTFQQVLDLSLAGNLS
jgi:hypothetical protein